MKFLAKGKHILALVLVLVLIASCLPLSTLIFAVDEGTNSEESSVLHKMVKINSNFSSTVYLVPGDSANQAFYSSTYFPKVMEIVAVKEVGGITYYQVKAALDFSWSPSATYTEHNADIWIKSNEVDFVEPCDKCKEYECGSSHENWCEICKVDDCTNDHIFATVTDSEGKDQTITVAGKLPQGAGLMVSEVEKPEFDFDTEISVYSYDISLHAGGNKIQPSAPVTLTFENVKLYDGGVVYVCHVLDDVAAIQAGIENGTAGSVKSAEFGLTDSAAEAAAEAATGESGVVYVEIFSNEDKNITIYNQSVSITVQSFSPFYLVSGDTRKGGTVGEITEITEGETKDIYVMPGTIIKLHRNGDYVWWRWTSTASGITAQMDTGATVGTSWSSLDAAGGLSSDDEYCTVTVSSNAAAGAVATLQSARGLFSKNEQTNVNIYVLSKESLVNKILENNAYPVALACLSNSTSIPGEPGVALNSFYFVKSGYGFGGGDYATFAAKGQGIISSNIATNPNFVTSADGTNTMGIVDATGVKTKNVVTGVDWDRALKAIVGSGSELTASDGTKVTSSNVDYYEMLPYVVKLQTSLSLGWHIDCMVVPRDTATLSYSLNLPGGSAVSDIAVPSGVNKPSPHNVTVAAPSVNGSNLAVGSKVTTTDNREFTFEGWYTNSSGTGNRVDIGSNLTITENTVLYGKWSGGGYTVGTLVVGKLVETAPNSHSPNADDKFTFTIRDKSSNSLLSGNPYTIYDGTTYAVVETGTINNGSFTLKANQAIYILNVKTDPKNPTTYTIQEAGKTYYTADSATKTVTIAGGVENTVVFTNTYNKPIQHNVTGTIIGNGTVTNDSQTINQGSTSAAMVFTPAEGYEIVKIMVGSTQWPVTDKNSFTYPAQTNVTGAINVVVTTQLKSYSVTGSIKNGSVTNSSQKVDHGQSSNAMVFTPDEGYEIVKIMVGSTQLPVTDKNSFTYPAQTNVTADVAVVVTTAAKSYTVTWIVDGEETEAVYQFGAPIVKPADPEKEGHTFSKWDKTIPATMPAQNLTFTAQWTINTYKVTWIVDGEETVVSYEYGAAIVRPADPSKPGSKFIGWDAEVPATMPAHALIFTAQFEQDATTLIIKVTNCNTTLDPEQSFLFNVADKNGVFMKVVVLENGSVTIKGLTIGETYTVTMDDAWSWRYSIKHGTDIQSSNVTAATVTNNSVTFTLGQNGEINFKVTRNTDKWLDGNDYYNGN